MNLIPSVGVASNVRDFVLTKLNGLFLQYECRTLLENYVRNDFKLFTSGV